MSLQHDRIAELCEQLKFARLGSDWPALAQDAARDGASFADFLEKVLASERVARDERKRTVLMRLATMPAIKSLEQFDWAQAGGAPKAQIMELGHLAFVERAENVVLLGPSGVGKTHLAKALVESALAAGHRALFVDAQAALDDLAAARAAGRLRARLRHYLTPHLLCLDAIAYQRIDIERLDLFYDLVRKRYDARRAIVITAVLPFANWPSVMPSSAATAALVDRFVHRATVIAIEGQSYRKKQAIERAAAHR